MAITDPRQLLLAAKLDPREVGALLAPFGFTDPQRADRLLQDLAGPPPGRLAVAEALPELLGLIAEAADPDRALVNLTRYAEAIGDRTALVRDLQSNPMVLEGLVRIVGASQYMADILARSPHLIHAVSRSAGPLDRKALEEKLAAELATFADEENRRGALRRFKREQVLRVAWLDLARGAPVEQVAHELSVLADTLVTAALKIAREEFEAEQEGAGDVRLVVLAMGKLGGEELNYSSDIDLVFIHEPRDGEDPRTAADLVRRTVQVLTDTTDGEALYRVDLRLRPEGAAGPVVRSVGSTLEYYRARGRTWERQALLKARPVAGAIELGERFLDGIAPFVFRRVMRPEDIAQIQALRRTMEAQARETVNVKTGPGGLRDVEFAVQFLQLLCGATLPELRRTGTLPALTALEKLGILSPSEAGTLREAYRFHRVLEHRLMNLHAIQTHEIPDDPALVRAIARSMACAGPDHAASLQAAREAHARATRAVLEHLLFHLFPDGGSDEGRAILDPNTAEEELNRILATHGFRELPQARANLKGLIGGADPRSGRWRADLAGSSTALLRRIGGGSQPDGALHNLERVASRLPDRGPLFRAFADARLRHALVSVLEGGDFLPGLLAAEPAHLDRLIEVLKTGSPLQGDGFPDAGAILARLPPPGAAAEPGALAAWRDAGILLAGAMDLSGRANLRTTMAVLTGIAESITRALLEGLEGPPLAVIGLGKFGGGELSYASDLDLLLVARARDIDAASHRAQELVRSLGEGSPPLWRVDMRLRPEGASGSLVTTPKGLDAYLADRGRAIWERLALTRARFVAGDEDIGRRAVATIRERIPLAPGEDAAPGVRDMRRRLEETAGAGDLKRGLGGLVDVEFLVQFLGLRHGREDPEAVEPSTFRGLHHHRVRGRLGMIDFSTLLTAYEFLRTLESRLHLLEHRPKHSLPEEPRLLETLARRAGFVDTVAATASRNLLEEYQHHARAVRALFDRLLGA